MKKISNFPKFYEKQTNPLRDLTCHLREGEMLFQGKKKQKHFQFPLIASANIGPETRILRVEVEEKHHKC